ncbi:hypothetical protein GGH13_009048, partial [Coemansia sp. S155-1]
SLIDLRSRIELLADDGMRTIMSFDNGHAPTTALSVPSSPQSQGGNPLLTKLPPSCSDSEESGELKSGSGEIVLEGESSEEEWVTDL